MGVGGGGRGEGGGGGVGLDQADFVQNVSQVCIHTLYACYVHSILQGS